MSFHLLAFQASIANSGALIQLNGIADPVVRASSNGFQVPPTLNRVGALWAVGASLGRNQLQAPSLRSQPFPTFYRGNIGTANERPIGLNYLFDNPLILAPYEELDAFGSQTSAGAATQTLFAILFDSPPQPARGPFLRVRWTASATLTANSWSSVTPTFDQALQVGNYAICGSWAFSATALAHRLVPASGPVWQPGGPAYQSKDGMDSGMFTDGSLGQWMQFNSLTPPNVAMFATGADTAEEGWMLLLPL